MSDVVLSPEQQRVVDSDAAALVVVAGAGSGKTEVVARRVERLLSADPDGDGRVLAVSFTVKAADELRARVRHRLGHLHRRVDADTVHGFALSVVRQFGTRLGLPIEPEVLAQPADRVEMLEEWLREQGRTVDDLRRLFEKLDLARAKGQESAPFLQEWRDCLAAHGAVDYPAMLDVAAELLEVPAVGRVVRRAYDEVVVDEAQNLTEAQYRVITTLLGLADRPAMRATMVGDDRQSIVGFAGADHRLMARFARDYAAERHELAVNYRCSTAVAWVSTAVAAALGNPSAGTASYSAEGQVTVHPAVDERAEAAAVLRWAQGLLQDGLSPPVVPSSEGVRAEDIAVLCRTTSGLQATRRALLDADLEVAEAGTEDDWLTTVRARAALALLGCLTAATHRSARRQLAALVGVEWPADVSAAQLLGSSPVEEVRPLRALAESEGPEQFLEMLEELPSEDVGWPDDIKLLLDAWDAFVDESNVGARTFANFWRFLSRRQRGDQGRPGVRLLTIHKAQGQEFKAVALVGLTDGQLPDFRARTEGDVEAELRAFYVAVSRASRSLLLTYPRQRETKYGPRLSASSPFLEILSAHGRPAAAGHEPN